MVQKQFRRAGGSNTAELMNSDGQVSNIEVAEIPYMWYQRCDVERRYQIEDMRNNFVPKIV